MPEPLRVEAITDECLCCGAQIDAQLREEVAELRAENRRLLLIAEGFSASHHNTLNMLQELVEHMETHPENTTAPAVCVAGADLISTREGTES